jgi:hypothetical protein
MKKNSSHPKRHPLNEKANFGFEEKKKLDLTFGESLTI